MIDLTFVTRLGLLLIRPGMLVATAPPFGALYTPTPVKLGLSVILGIAIAPSVAMPATLSPGGLAIMALREALIGLALGLAVRVLMAGAELGGQLAGFQIGFAYAATVDPQTGARNNLVAALYSSLTLLTFLGINGHHVLLRALEESFRVMPIGLGQVDAGLARTVASFLGVLFVFGSQVAAPVVVVVLIAELAMGLLSRAAPSLNLMALGFPIRLLAGLVALAGAISVLPGVVARFVTPALELAGRLAYGLK